MDIKNLTIKDIQENYKSGKSNPKELYQDFVSLIAKINPDLNAYLSIFDSSLEIENLKSKISPTPLIGVPCAIKDNILINRTITTAGSKILENYVAPYDATVISKLKKAGAVFLGKTNMDEFAMGASTENSAFGPTRNPHDSERVPGGSSGGSAVAVAAGLAPFALGSDTGGSIRQPAAFCGVVGLKPTYGRVSRYGLMAMASGFDQIGPITKNVYDSALVLNVIAGHDPKDSTSSPLPVLDYTQKLGRSIKGLRVGVPKEYFVEGLDPQVESSVKEAISTLEKLGAKIGEATLPHSPYALATYYIIVPSEVSANLARYDGIRYGQSSEKSGNLFETYSESRAEYLGEEVKRRIMIGTYALSAGYYDAYYLKAQKIRTLIRRDYEEAFKQFDVLVGPTTPTPAFKIGEQVNDPLSMYLADTYTVSAPIAGLPAISIPCASSADVDGKKLPIGFQITGNKFDEATVLQVAYAYEQAIK